MTYTELQRKLKVGIKGVRRQYRRADTAGERLQRALDKLVVKKRLLQPEDLSSSIHLYSLYMQQVAAIDSAFKDALNSVEWNRIK